MVGALLDLAIASVILLVLLVVYQMPLTWNLLFLPLAFVLLVMFTLSIGQFLAALSVNYRDIKYALPFVVQMWFFASPVIYPLSMVPKKFQWVPSLNPMVGIIELVRALVADRPIPWQALGVSVAVTVVAMCLGLLYFNRTERRFADVV